MDGRIEAAIRAAWPQGWEKILLIVERWLSPIRPQSCAFCDALSSELPLVGLHRGALSFQGGGRLGRPGFTMWMPEQPVDVLLRFHGEPYAFACRACLGTPPTGDERVLADVVRAIRETDEDAERLVTQLERRVLGRRCSLCEDGDPLAHGRGVTLCARCISEAKLCVDEYEDF